MSSPTALSDAIRLSVRLSVSLSVAAPDRNTYMCLFKTILQPHFTSVSYHRPMSLARTGRNKAYTIMDTPLRN